MDNIHIVVTRPNRALILVNDLLYVRDIKDAESLLLLAHTYENPPIVIDVGAAWGWELMNSAVQLGYLNISRTTD